MKKIEKRAGTPKKDPIEQRKWPINTQLGIYLVLSDEEPFHGTEFFLVRELPNAEPAVTIGDLDTMKAFEIIKALGETNLLWSYTKIKKDESGKKIRHPGFNVGELEIVSVPNLPSVIEASYDLRREKWYSTEAEARRALELYASSMYGLLEKLVKERAEELKRAEALFEIASQSGE